MKKYFKYLPIAVFVFAITLASCSKSSHKSDHLNDIDSVEVKDFVHAMMRQFYYWSDSVPFVNIAAEKGNSVQDVFEYYLSPIDRWSWMMNGRTYNSLESGISTSYGFHLAQPIEYYDDYDIYITYVDKNSPLAKAGVTRGYQLTHINGTDVSTLIKNGSFYSEIEKSSNKFTFKTTGGEEKELSLAQTSFQSNSVALTKVFTSAQMPALKLSDKVGYILYNTFNNTRRSEISTALQQMKSEGVTDLILDLRYNGGGDLDVCTEIASLIAPASADTKVFLTLKHNLANRSDDYSYYINRTANSLDLDRLFVLTGSGTASASESIINCLSPYMEVQTIGEQTYGKPNGMYIFLYPQNVPESQAEYAFLPICFYCMNVEDKADFNDGIVPKNVRYDDLYHDFSAEEDLIKAALTYIATGKYPSLPAVATTKASFPAQRIYVENGFKGAYVKRK